MVEYNDATLDTLFHALGDSTRRGMLHELAGGERTVGQLAEPYAMSLAAAAKHIQVLEGARLVHKERRGRMHVCRLEPQALRRASDWLRYYERFWNTRLDVLENLLRDADAKASSTGAAGTRAPRRTPPPPKGKRS
ncbi:MAG: helix-turn-helix transcriptional regulator [Proteobacteria bacterium]|nr:helix-turn-helix transcriptional regulator [Pseudomonadota bacterium]